MNGASVVVRPEGSGSTIAPEVLVSMVSSIPVSLSDLMVADVLKKHHKNVVLLGTEIN